MSWLLSELPKPTGPTVFSCFHCGGGSSMGYKLAGCRVLGGVEIDPAMMEVYRANLHPQVSYLSDIRTAPVPDIPIDILDGSPPCSSFSSSGKREKAWGKEKAFREGQVKQRLDDLFFAFLDYAAKLRPRVIVAENVTGLLAGNARAYAKRIVETYRELGYTVSVFRLNAADFGVPQARERVFFIGQLGHAKPLTIKPTSERRVTAAEAFAGIEPLGRPLTAFQVKHWQALSVGRIGQWWDPKKAWDWSNHGSYSEAKVNPNDVARTLCAGSRFYHWAEPYELSPAAYARLQSFPDDYNFLDARTQYVCGMSVPPLLMRGIAEQLVQQVF